MLVDAHARRLPIIASVLDVHEQLEMIPLLQPISCAHISHGSKRRSARALSAHRACGRDGLLSLRLLATHALSGMRRAKSSIAKETPPPSFCSSSRVQSASLAMAGGIVS